MRHDTDGEPLPRLLAHVTCGKEMIAFCQSLSRGTDSLENLPVAFAQDR